VLGLYYLVWWFAPFRFLVIFTRIAAFIAVPRISVLRLNKWVLGIKMPETANMDKSFVVRTRMKAIVCTRYGFPKAIQLKEVEKPVPGDHEVLVENHASCVNYNNQLLSEANSCFPFINGWAIDVPVSYTGTNLAGRVEAVGKNIALFKPGDDVYGDLLGMAGLFRRFVCAPEVLLRTYQLNLSYEEAAVLPEARLVALRACRTYGACSKGHKVLIYSASGGIGNIRYPDSK